VGSLLLLLYIRSKIDFEKSCNVYGILGSYKWVCCLRPYMHCTSNDFNQLLIKYFDNELRNFYGFMLPNQQEVYLLIALDFLDKTSP
jgi:hypothetical protein